MELPQSFKTLFLYLNKYKMYILIALILIIISITLYYYVLAPKSQPKFFANNEGTSNTEMQSENKTAELLFFYADWCPHCKTAKPIWEELKTTYSKKSINGYKILFTAVNCTEENAEVEKLINKYNVEGYPTIKLIKDNKVIDFEAKPTKENLDKFINTML